MFSNPKRLKNHTISKRQPVQPRYSNTTLRSKLKICGINQKKVHSLSNKRVFSTTSQSNDISTPISSQLSIQQTPIELLQLIDQRLEHHKLLQSSTIQSNFQQELYELKYEQLKLKEEQLKLKEEQLKLQQEQLQLQNEKFKLFQLHQNEFELFLLHKKHQISTIPTSTPATNLQPNMSNQTNQQEQLDQQHEEVIEEVIEQQQPSPEQLAINQLQDYFQRNLRSHRDHEEPINIRFNLTPISQHVVFDVDIYDPISIILTWLKQPSTLADKLPSPSLLFHGHGPIITNTTTETNNDHDNNNNENDAINSNTPDADHSTPPIQSINDDEFNNNTSTDQQQQIINTTSSIDETSSQSQQYTPPDLTNVKSDENEHFHGIPHNINNIYFSSKSLFDGEWIQVAVGDGDDIGDAQSELYIKFIKEKLHDVEMFSFINTNKRMDPSEHLVYCNLHGKYMDYSYEIDVKW